MPTSILTECFGLFSLCTSVNYGVFLPIAWPLSKRWVEHEFYPNTKTVRAVSEVNVATPESITVMFVYHPCPKVHPWFTPAAAS